MPFLMSVGGFHYKLAQILTHVSSDFALCPAIRSNGRHAGASEQKKTKQMHLKQNITVRKNFHFICYQTTSMLIIMMVRKALVIKNPTKNKNLIQPPPQGIIAFFNFIQFNYRQPCWTQLELQLIPSTPPPTTPPPYPTTTPQYKMSSIELVVAPLWVTLSINIFNAHL